MSDATNGRGHLLGKPAPEAGFRPALLQDEPPVERGVLSIQRASATCAVRALISTATPA